MKIKNKKTFGKLTAAAIAFAAAVSIVCGGVATVSYAEEHKHDFSESWTAGYKNHWHSCECGTVKDMQAHNYIDGICKDCGAEQIDPAGAHTHTYNESKWVYDSVYHWHASACGHNIIKDVTPHTVNEEGECVCGWIDITKIPAQVPENISVAGGYNESLYAEWNSRSVNNVTAYYQKYGEDEWVQIDAPLVRMKDAATARVDAVGLTAGVYNLKIVLDGNESIVRNINVTEYDRSGYAHFNYTSGIGAYNDDGTLKDNALVIYVTDSNKNDITDFVYKNTENGLVKEDISKYIKSGVPAHTNGVALGGDSYASIGYLLNNRGYANNTERAAYGIQKLTFTYSGVAIRILDTVYSEYNADGSPTLNGLTYYAKSGGTNPITGDKYASGGWVPNGGTVGDNGQMARITNAKNLTIEGIGEDAGLFGWGIHFVSNDNLGVLDGAGESFEVRNLTFQSYPEDAIGMEGTQGTNVDSTGSITGGASSASADLISPVERCWIHNNTFFPGYCANPAESDKAEGDGSCDFKRGQYYTLAYNYFEGCHKTNLIGSSDTSLTYNITMHHNWWNNCGARQPLARRGNIHYYNNYISGTTDYVSSFRANCLIFSEANYFDGCKNVTQKKDGVGVAWNNVYYSCYSENNYAELTSRTQTVPNECKFIYRNIDYSQFYIDSSLFYYNALTQTSDCLLDTAVEARVKVMMNAGRNGFGKPQEETQFNEYTPKSAVSVGHDGLAVNLASVTKDSSTVSNVEFNGVTGVASGTVKGKGQIITFTLASEAQLSVTTSTSGDAAPELVGADGTMYARKFTGTLTIVLQKGTYIICTGQKDKESVITELRFDDTADSSAARVKAAEDAINALPENITIESGEAVREAELAYSALTPSEKDVFSAELKLKLDAAVTAYENAQIDDVIAKIAAIGEVNEDSFELINTAQTAYNALSAAQKSQVTNAHTLLKAQEDYAQFAVINVINLIDALSEVDESITDADVIAELKAEYEKVFEIYEALGEGNSEGDINKKDLVTNSGKLFAGLDALSVCERLPEFRSLLEGVEADTVTIGEGALLKTAYEELTEVQKNALTAAEKAKYDSIMDVYTAAAKQAVSLSFTDGTDNYYKNPDNEYFTVVGSTRTNSAEKVTVDGVNYTTSLKSESSTKITFTTTATMTLTLYFDISCAGRKIDVDGKSYTIDGNGVVEITELAAATHTITKSSSNGTNVFLFLITLIPA